MARPSGSDNLRDSRGVGVADFDGDGRLDLVINSNNDKATLYRNLTQRAGNWLKLKLVGRESNRDAVGAKVRLLVGNKTITRYVQAGTGYASQSSLILHFGLGNEEEVEKIDITWPSGHQQRVNLNRPKHSMKNQTLEIQEAGSVTRLVNGRARSTDLEDSNPEEMVAR